MSGIRLRDKLRGTELKPRFQKKNWPKISSLTGIKIDEIDIAI